MGQHNGVVGKVAGELQQAFRRGGALAGVLVADRFGGVDDDRQAALPQQAQQRGHNAGVGDVESLGVGMEFADAGGAPVNAAGSLLDSRVAPGGFTEQKAVMRSE